MIHMVVCLSPAFMESSALSNLSSPFNPSVSPQFIGESLSVHTFIRDEYGVFKRYALSVEYGGVGLSMHTLNVEEVFINQIALGMNFGWISGNVAYTLEEEVWMGVGFLRTFQNFSLCGYTTLYGRRFSYMCFLSQHPKGSVGMEAFMEEGFPVEYKLYIRYALSDELYVSFAYNSETGTLFASLNYRWILVGYCEHELLGSCLYSRISYTFDG